jgi:hypothetical protein
MSHEYGSDSTVTELWIEAQDNVKRHKTRLQAALPA